MFQTITKGDIMKLVEIFQNESIYMHDDGTLVITIDGIIQDCQVDSIEQGKQFIDTIHGQESIKNVKTC
jgi:hypothetical protein